MLLVYHHLIHVLAEEMDITVKGKMRDVDTLLPMWTPSSMDWLTIPLEPDR
jgi:hypothetical protein